MTRMWLITAALLLIACSNAPAQSLPVTHEGEHAAQQRLCDVLATIREGERRVVTLTGIYAAGFEHGIFYDPSTPTCASDVQPETWVQVAPGVTSSDLSRLFERRAGSWETRRAYVTFTGELFGPGVVGPDDVLLPQFAAFANRTRNRRYGHLNGYRTKFVVTKISNVESVPQAVPWPAARSAQTTPVVERAEVPRYPAMAWNVGITGEVVLDVTVSSGQVVNVDIKSGDRMLTGEAIRNVKTWQFAADTNATFTTTFSFNVEPRNTGASAAPRIELQLPERVQIVAPRNAW